MKINENQDIVSSVALATLQALSGHMWLVDPSDSAQLSTIGFLGVGIVSLHL